jgi:hypothetical protein
MLPIKIGGWYKLTHLFCRHFLEEMSGKIGDKKPATPPKAR